MPNDELANEYGRYSYLQGSYDAALAIEYALNTSSEADPRTHLRQALEFYRQEILQRHPEFKDVILERAKPLPQ